MGNERERLIPGQVRPRRLFLGAFPIGSQSGFAQECGLRPIRFQNSDEHARPRRQRKRLFRPDLPFLVDFGFDRWEHGVNSTSVSASPSSMRSVPAETRLAWERTGRWPGPALGRAAPPRGAFRSSRDPERPASCPMPNSVGRGFIAPNSWRRVDGALQLRATPAPYRRRASMTRSAQAQNTR